jgi:hypothetical protein
MYGVRLEMKRKVSSENVVVSYTFQSLKINIVYGKQLFNQFMKEEQLQELGR